MGNSLRRVCAFVSAGWDERTVVMMKIGRISGRRCYAISHRVTGPAAAMNWNRRTEIGEEQAENFILPEPGTATLRLDSKQKSPQIICQGARYGLSSL
jgi:hypothetical protein